MAAYRPGPTRRLTRHATEKARFNHCLCMLLGEQLQCKPWGSLLIARGQNGRSADEAEAVIISSNRQAGTRILRLAERRESKLATRWGRVGSKQI